MTDDCDDGAPVLEVPESLPTPICWGAYRPDEVLIELDPLTVWVTWLTEHYRLDRRHVPDCWDQHWELIEELAALHHSWKAAFAHDTAEAHGPLLWHERFHSARQRLSEWTARAGCRPGEHRGATLTVTRCP